MLAVLVPFPVESCLSGLQNATLPGSPPTYQHMVYRTLIDGGAMLREAAGLAQGPGDPGAVLLHFGAVDWQAEVYVNGMWVGSHEGGYDGFAFDIAHALHPLLAAVPSPSSGADGSVPPPPLDEIMVVAHDPSNYGSQPFGKQRTSAMWRPAGDTYSPVSGIWQPVWLEPAPAAGRIDAVRLAPNTTHLTLSVATTPGGCGAVSVTVHTDSDPAVAAGSGRPNIPFSVPIPAPMLWSPERPFLYNLTVRCGADAVESYFGMRTVSVGRDPTTGANRPCINGEYRFLTGVLDQSFWPDGIYTAPGDRALASDLEAVKGFGQNYVRLHQKVNPDRWYYHADRLGVVVAQDVVQHYGDAVQGAGSEMQSDNGGAKARHYFHDLKALIDGRGSHPCIIQYDLFNEQDMVEDFNVSGVVRWVRGYDPTRLIDADSGGPVNVDHLGDVRQVSAIFSFFWPL